MILEGQQYETANWGNGIILGFDSHIDLAGNRAGR
jgi:hypothetical protein